MKKVATKQSPPKLIGGCAPPRWPLVAMDALETAGRRARSRARARGRGGVGVPHSLVIPGSRGAGPRSQPQPHHEVSKEGVPLQNTRKQILGGRRTD